MIDGFLADLRERYGGEAVAVRTSGTTTLARISSARIPRRKATAEVMVEVPAGALERGERPNVYVGEDTVQPNGRRGRNVNPAQVHGETWLTFSWAYDWNPRLPAWALVEGALRRFSIDED